MHVSPARSTFCRLFSHSVNIPVLGDLKVSALQLLFWIALFISATLLFWIQPMFGKMALPLLGGTPAVWNTCLVFFQAALLLGYLYAHGQRKFLALRSQLVVHLVLFAAFFLFLPVAVRGGWLPPTESNPIPWLLLLLSVSVGFPFVILSATAPLLQNWFAQSGDSEAADPYFLYVASNLGSLAGLLGYPLLIEPHFTLYEQSWAWSAGYLGLLAAMICGAALLWNHHRPYSSPQDRACSPLTTKLRMHWLLLAAVPSSLLQSVTSHITTDIASVPLLWVLPLAVYLITFVLVFSRREWLPHRFMVGLQPFFILATVVLVFWINTRNFAWIFPCNLIVLFLTGMVCHGELVKLRPATEHLTEFYLWMSAGGVLGGIFNAILAPAIFDTLAEYPITLIMAALLRPGLGDDLKRLHAFAMDLMAPLLLAVLLAIAVWGVRLKAGTQIDPVYLGLLACLAAALVYSFSWRPVRFGLGVAALIGAGLLVGTFTAGAKGEVLHRERNFFGSLQVVLDKEPNRIHLVHNTTSHGAQNRKSHQLRMPTTYFSQPGPLGDVFKCLPQVSGGRRVAVVGLGAGTMACYAQPGDRWVFYEINPAVVRLASRNDYFTYLADCPAKMEIVLGDARLSIATAPEHSYDLIIVDAFSSDAIPVHLVTKEAIALYLTKLAKGGLLVFNITNNHMDLGLVFRNLALDSDLFGLARFHGYNGLPKGQWQAGIVPSYWVALARKPEDLRCLGEISDWKVLDLVAPPDAPTRPWTDDFSNILQCLMMFRSGDSARVPAKLR